MLLKIIQDCILILAEASRVFPERPREAQRGMAVRKREEIHLILFIFATW